ncbi:LCP family protein [Streptacidiphilus jiangxiensis]|uniref:Cell envelope-related function transcriptional attenuator common domain-containing protein n=1 Tax=Streptacidiphilus jiangxiensis TaxID=235985 RepID=A0A1H7PRW4_STRJI|nr:LCP family protein [Streptacidiphilus jiangxiensis]SEL38326.1 cell envelope-related function transcriptional attenuator common domain-containing protein [Streptacidiphilus jiangxiensis]
MTPPEESFGGRAAARRAGRGKSAPAGAVPTGRRKTKPKKRGKRIAMGVSAFVVLVAAAGCAWVYQLDSNIKHSALDTGSSPQKGAVIPGAINIMLIGSDTRIGGNASLGGQDNSLPHADVEMLLHVSADHQNATVMSIPRDTDTQIPDCTQNGKTYHFGAHDQITNSLNYGPGCTVSAVNALTGVHIDHFMVVDFDGVVNMSDAVGGVDVCTTHNVYDPGSHLKLSAGSHTLVGQGALEFLRTRHAFGNASDIDRTVTQHIFLSALMHKMKSASTLADPTNVYSLAEAATRAFQVDNGLNSITKLISLANTLAGIPTSHITFVTMPAINDPYNPNAWLAPAPNAQQLFNAIANDQSLSGGSSTKPTAGASASASAAVDPSSIEVHVFNGTGVPGRAAAVQTELAGKGYSNSIVEHTAMSVSSSKVEYSASDPQYKREAQQVASALGLPSSSLTVTPGLTTVHVVVGSDLKVGSGSGSAAPKPSANIGQATQGASAEIAGDTVKCAQASPFPLGGLPASAAAYQGLTVEQAYALATKNGIPDSDKQK